MGAASLSMTANGDFNEARKLLLFGDQVFGAQGGGQALEHFSQGRDLECPWQPLAECQVGLRSLRRLVNSVHSFYLTPPNWRYLVNPWLYPRLRHDSSPQETTDP